MGEDRAQFGGGVPEGKTIKNRLHLWLRPETSREQEVDRLPSLGATFVVDHRNPDGPGLGRPRRSRGRRILRSAQ